MHLSPWPEQPARSIRGMRARLSKSAPRDRLSHLSDERDLARLGSGSASGDGTIVHAALMFASYCYFSVPDDRPGFTDLLVVVGQRSAH